MSGQRGDTLAADYAEAGSGWREQQVEQVKRDRVMELAKCVDERIDALERRVAEIEKGRKGDPRFPAGAPTADVHIPTECYERTFERVFIDASDLARLRRIEEAALRIIPLIDAMTLKSENDFDMAQALLDALKR